MKGGLAFSEAFKAEGDLYPAIFSASERYRNCLRLSCGHPWSPEREQAIVKLGRLIATHARRRSTVAKSVTAPSR